MVFYKVGDSWFDSSKDEELLQSVFSLLRDEIDSLLAGHNCVRCSDKLWFSQELQSLIFIDCLPLHACYGRMEKSVNK